MTAFCCFERASNLLLIFVCYTDVRSRKVPRRHGGPSFHLSEDGPSMLTWEGLLREAAFPQFAKSCRRWEIQVKCQISLPGGVIRMDRMNDSRTRVSLLGRLR